MTDSPDALSPIDEDALRRCLELYLADRKRGPVIQARLDGGEPWRSVARFCSYSIQRNRLSLKPWQASPCHPYDADGLALYERLIAAGLSRFENDPVRALAELEKPKRR
jgi:hypothetical protein